MILALIVVRMLGKWLFTFEFHYSQTENMRLLKAKDFLKVIKGDDIEFRVQPYEIVIKEPVVIEGIDSIYSLEFPKIKFNSLTFKNCQFKGGLRFNHVEGRTFSFGSSSIENLELIDSRVNTVVVDENERLGTLYLDRTDINNLSISNNESFERLHLGCKNNVLRATFSRNGYSNATESSVYICPERFTEIEIREMNASTVEIGTFGEHSKLTVDGILADDFKIKNCDFTKSQVSLKNIRPLEKKKSHLTIEDSKLDDTVMKSTEMKMFGGLNIHNSEVGNLQNVVLEFQRFQKASFWKISISSLFLW